MRTSALHAGTAEDAGPGDRNAVALAGALTLARLAIQRLVIARETLLPRHVEALAGAAA